MTTLLTARDAPLEQRLAELLEDTRRRTLELIEPLSDDGLNAVHDPMMSPIAWDLGHIANFEEIWLVQNAGHRRPLRDELGAVYDQFVAPRRDRGKLPYLKSEDCLDYMKTVRERSLALLAEADLSGRSEPVLAGGFIYELVARHEQQHSETILQTLQIMTSENYIPPGGVSHRSAASAHTAPGAPTASLRDGMMLVEGGPFEMGARPDWFAYDNERPLHQVEVDSFWIDRHPVTNANMLDFIEDGGYRRRELWSEKGWQWRQKETIALPKYWKREHDSYWVREFGRTQPLDPARPVCHVSWHEAEAFARWAGKRLPTEAEWEKAACWSPQGSRKALYPWGDEPYRPELANLDQLCFGTSAIGSHPAGAGAYGVQEMSGGVWEWTASGFEGYPGFEAFPYREYSTPFFGGPFKVLRGGAWATQPLLGTTTFRNWDYADRRQIFAGFRCALDQDASPSS
jgi:gamma-glutamyl hercynylcysteine S-oxide synthase